MIDSEAVKYHSGSCSCLLVFNGKCLPNEFMCKRVFNKQNIF